MKKITLTLGTALLALSLLLGACAPAATPQPTSAPADGPTAEPGAPVTDTVEPLEGTISISGAFALYPMMTVWADEFKQIHPDVEFDVQGGGAGKGMTDTLSGAVDIGMISRAIKPEEESQGAYWVAVTKDAVFPIVSAQNPVAAELAAQGVTPETFNGIFITGTIKTWGQVVGKPEITDAIHVFTRSDSAGAADIWAQFAGAKAQADILATAIGVNGEPALVDQVIKDPLSIGFSNLNSVFDTSSGKLVAGALVPPIDNNTDGKADADEYYQSKAEAVAAVSSGKYPSPPSRFEFLATKGKPTGLVLAFINWIVTDGQQYLDAAGYVPLTADQQAESLTKLK